MGTGVWTTIKYFNEIADPGLPDLDPAKLRPTIYLWVRDLNGKRFRLKIRGFKPYFFVPPWLNGKSMNYLKEPEIERLEEKSYEGRKFIKVFVYIPGHVVKIKRAIQKAYVQRTVSEGDVLYVLRYLVDKKIRSGIKWSRSGIKPHKDRSSIKLRKIYIDIEVWGKRFVAAGKMRKGECIKCLTAFDSYEKIYYTWYFNDKDLEIKGNKTWKVIWCDSVKSMMSKFFNYVKERDPDVITGYNVDYDLLTIRQEALREGIARELDYLSALHDVGYGIGRPVTKRHRIRGVDWKRRGLLLSGREVIDILDLVRMRSTTQLTEYTLDFVSRKFINDQEGKVTYKGKRISSDIQGVWEKAPKVVLEYNKHDVKLCVLLDENNDLIDFLDTLRRTVGVRLGDAFSQQRMIDTEELRRRIIPLPSKFTNKNEKKSYKGALVIEPKLGFHKWVICLDWKSLYPCIMRTFNIDTDTFMATKKILFGRDFYQFSNLDNTQTWMFLKEPRGLIPLMLDDFTTLRDLREEKLKTEKDPMKRKILKGEGESFKILSNACYGSFGYRSRKHSLMVAEAITSFGQIMIKFASDIAEELGFVVVYGDTDSVLVEAGKNTYGEAYNEGIRLQDEILKRIPAFLKQFRWEETDTLFYIKLEKLYDTFFMATKKRYCGRIVNSEGKSEIDIKGLATKRSDTSYFAQKLQRRLLLKLLREQGQKNIVLEEIIFSLNGYDKLPLKEIGVPSAISKTFKAYKGNPIQKRAAMNSNTYLGTKFKIGNKPKRVYTLIPETRKIYPRKSIKTDEERKAVETELKGLYVMAFDETTKFPKWVKVDYPKMIFKTVKPKLEAVTEALDITWKEIEERLVPGLRMPKKKKRKKKKDPSVKLDKFIRRKKKKC